MPKKTKKFDDLEFVRIIQPDIIGMIPRRLFEQIDGTDDEMIGRIYEFGVLSVANPLNLIYALVDDKKVVHGVLWANIDLICGVLWVKLFSVDKEYQSDAIKKTTNFLIKEIKKTKITRIECQTARPKSYEKAGWTESEQIHLMFEVDNGNDQDTQKRDNPSGPAKSTKS